MIILESKEYDIILKASKDYRGYNVYMVVYGLEVKTFDEFDDALDQYTNALKHAIECDGVLGEYL